MRLHQLLGVAKEGNVEKSNSGFISEGDFAFM
jgi:hypothetical protein